MTHTKDSRVKKPYEKPRVIAVEELGGKTGPCQKTQADSTCVSGAFS